MNDTEHHTMRFVYGKTFLCIILWGIIRSILFSLPCSAEVSGTHTQIINLLKARYDNNTQESNWKLRFFDVSLEMYNEPYLQQLKLGQQIQEPVVHLLNQLCRARKNVYAKLQQISPDGFHEDFLKKLDGTLYRDPIIPAPGEADLQQWLNDIAEASTLKKTIKEVSVSILETAQQRRHNKYIPTYIFVHLEEQCFHGAIEIKMEKMAFSYLYPLLIIALSDEPMSDIRPKAIRQWLGVDSISPEFTFLGITLNITKAPSLKWLNHKYAFDMLGSDEVWRQFKQEVSQQSEEETSQKTLLIDYTRKQQFYQAVLYIFLHAQAKYRDDVKKILTSVGKTFPPVTPFRASVGQAAEDIDISTPFHDNIQTREFDENSPLAPLNDMRKVAMIDGELLNDTIKTSLCLLPIKITPERKIEFIPGGFAGYFYDLNF